MTGILVVAALTREAAHLHGVDILITGVGKAAAAAALGRRLADGPLPAAVVNIGTAGSLDATYSGVLEIDWVTQHDFPYAAIEALVGTGSTPRGYLLRPGAAPEPADVRPETAVALATGDAFVNDPRKAAGIAAMGVHLVDMEAFALAATCAEFGVPFRCVKAVSDAADAGAAASWVDMLDSCARDLAAWVTRIGVS